MGAFDAGAQAHILARLPAAASYYFFGVRFTGSVDVRLPAGQAVLRFVLGPCEFRLGAYPRPQRQHSAAQLLLAQAVQERCSFRLSTFEVQAAPQALLPLPAAKRKRTLSAGDDMVQECLKRLLDDGEDWEHDVAPVKAYLKLSHPKFLYSKEGQGFLQLLQKEWRDRNPDFEPFEMPLRKWMLTLWQRRFVYPILTTLPEKRRLFWCHAPRDAGKGTVVEFLSDRRANESNVFQHTEVVFRGIMNATLLLQNLEKFTMRYSNKAVRGKPPGIIYCDFMHDFTFTDEVWAALERFTDVGQELEHGRFQGSQVCLHSHVVVFANEGPPASFSERCVWLLRPQSLGHQPVWEYPFKQPGHVAASVHQVALSAAVPLPEDAAPAPPVGGVAPLVAGGGCVVM